MKFLMRKIERVPPTLTLPRRERELAPFSRREKGWG